MRQLPLIFCAALLALGSSGLAQEIQVTPLDDLLESLENDNGLSLNASASQTDVTSGTGGDLRVLDKLTGAVVDLSLGNGDVAQLASLSVSMVDCRYPTDNPAGDAFSYVEVFDRNENESLFAGWMLASAPALNAMDHPRYDVWALRCSTS